MVKPHRADSDFSVQYFLIFISLRILCRSFITRKQFEEIILETAKLLMLIPDFELEKIRESPLLH